MAINAMPVLINPLDPFLDIVFDTDLRVRLNSTNIPPIAANEGINLSLSILEIELSDADNIAIDVAIPSNDATFMLDVNDIRVSLTPSRISENCSFMVLISFLLNIFPIDSCKVFSNFDAFFAATYIPLPAKPAKRSPAEILSVRYENTLVPISQISVRAFPATVLAILRTSLNDSIFVIAGAMKAATVLNPLDNLPNKKSPKSSIDVPLFSSVKKSPTLAVTVNNALPTDANPPEPINFLIGDVATVKPRLIKLNAEKSPLKDLCILSLTSELYINPNDSE